MERSVYQNFPETKQSAISTYCLGFMGNSTFFRKYRTELPAYLQTGRPHDISIALLPRYLAGDFSKISETILDHRNINNHPQARFERSDLGGAHRFIYKFLSQQLFSNHNIILSRCFVECYSDVYFNTV